MAADEEFDEMDMETGNQLVVLVWDPEDQSLEIENPHDMPYPLVLGILHAAIVEWEDSHAAWAFADDEDD